MTLSKSTCESRPEAKRVYVKGPYASTRIHWSISCTFPDSSHASDMDMVAQNFTQLVLPIIGPHLASATQAITSGRNHYFRISLESATVLGHWFGRNPTPKFAVSAQPV